FADNQVYLKKKIRLRESSAAKEDFLVRDGDLIFAMMSDLQRVVKLSGHVVYPGLVAYKEGMTLQDLFSSSDIVSPGAIMRNALIKRYNLGTGYFDIIYFSLQAVLDRSFDAPLVEYDEVIVLDKVAYDIQENVYISGAVWKPGKYPFSPGMKLSSLIGMAGGVKKSGNLSGIELSRHKIERGLAKTVREIVDWNALRTAGKDVVLQEKDFVMIKEVKGFGALKVVTIEGEVAYPGTYAVADGDRLSGLLERAGGFTGSAYLFGSSFTRQSAKETKQRNYERLIENLEMELGRATAKLAKEGTAATETVLAAQTGFVEKLKEKEMDGRIVINLASVSSLKGSKYDFELKDGDILSVPRKP
ncbi:MAG: SLBB domain-containing protein, partial [Desulfobulbaceae bacterium]|nr:SLBB domain-containing protein [Desulfobulbaceae bacterium]